MAYDLSANLRDEANVLISQRLTDLPGTAGKPAGFAR